MWALGVILVNAYVAYIAANVFTWKKKKSELISHYEFRKQIALALICPKLHGGKRSDENNEDERTTASATTTERPTKKTKNKHNFYNKTTISTEH